MRTIHALLRFVIQIGLKRLAQHDSWGTKPEALQTAIDFFIQYPVPPDFLSRRATEKPETDHEHDHQKWLGHLASILQFIVDSPLTEADEKKVAKEMMCVLYPSDGLSRDAQTASPTPLENLTQCPTAQLNQWVQDLQLRSYILFEMCSPSQPITVRVDIPSLSTGHTVGIDAPSPPIDTPSIPIGSPLLLIPPPSHHTHRRGIPPPPKYEPIPGPSQRLVIEECAPCSLHNKQNITNQPPNEAKRHSSSRSCGDIIEWASTLFKGWQWPS